MCVMECQVHIPQVAQSLTCHQVVVLLPVIVCLVVVEFFNAVLFIFSARVVGPVAFQINGRDTVPGLIRFFYIAECLEADQKGARKIKEVTDDGGVVSAYYQLKGVEADINRFVLFKVSKKGVITLVYIEGDLDSDDLITLFTKKDL